MMSAKKIANHIAKYLDPKPELVQITPRIPRDVADALERAARELDISVNKVALIAFRMFLERHEARKK